MNASQNAVDLVAQFEGFRAQPYKDAVGIPTIGYGSTHYLCGKPVTVADPAISESDAKALLLWVLQRTAQEVLECVTQPITQNQLDACACFAYNVGIGAFKGSTLLKLINAGKYDLAAQQFIQWTKAGGQVLPGLVRRRVAETKLFTKQ